MVDDLVKKNTEKITVNDSEKTDTQNQVLFKISNLGKAFGEHVVLNNVNIEIKQGEIFGIIGKSGSGKTTFLSILIGFIRPDAGDVKFKEEHLIEYKSDDAFVSVIKKGSNIKKLCGFAAQIPSFYPELTVKENLEYFGSLHGLSKEALRINMATLLKLMDLEEYKNLRAANLSGGMERRLDIACSLIHDPKILILDEPTADLDPLLRNQIWNLIKKVNKKGTTIIIASHHLEEIEVLCSRIGILHEGSIISVGTMAEIKDKFSPNIEIQLHSFPGDYKEISNIKHQDIISSEITDTSLIIYTAKPEKVLYDLLDRMESLKEKLVDVRVKKPSLDEIFIQIAQKDEKEKKKKEETDEKISNKKIKDALSDKEKFGL
ncbi:MAG: ABC transporter ATP-binding protein [Candidatus Woesearchaeota archaeon]